jgi:hypothetical protein
LRAPGRRWRELLGKMVGLQQVGPACKELPWAMAGEQRETANRSNVFANGVRDGETKSKFEQDTLGWIR